MKIIWKKVTWYSKLLTAIFFIIVFPALAFYIGRQYQAVNTIQVSPYIVTTFKWPTVAWRTYTSQNSKLSFEYPNSWFILADEIGSNKKVSPYLYPHIIICPPDFELSLAPKGNSPNNCIEFIQENTLLHPPLPDTEIENFKDFSEYMSTAEFPGNPNFYDANIMVDHSNYFVGFKRIGSRFTGLQQTTCLPGQSTQCILIFRHVLDSIKFLE